jgi:hypothetical protein
MNGPPPAQPSTGPRPPGAVSPGQPLRVLVVDDEPPALEELAYLLGRDARIGEVLTA